MNEMIERYIYDVTRRLPEKERGEVKRELEASILDMLPDSPSEQDTINVLTELGTPSKFAEQYRQNPRYLISPAIFELYISVLKTVVVIVAGICACIGLLTVVLSDSGSVAKLIENAVDTAMEGVFQAAFWVTAGFFIAEHHGLKQKPWTVNDLPRLPDQEGVKISRSSSIVGMVLSVFFTTLLIMMIVRNEWLFVVVLRDSEIIHPFSQAALGRCIPYLLILGALALIINGLKLYWGRWNTPLCIANAIQNIVWVSITVYILHWSDLFSDEFIAFTKTLTGDADILRFIESGMIVTFFTILFVGVAVIDIGIATWNTWKGIREKR